MNSSVNLHCLGTNHRTAPVEVREKLWFSPEEVVSFLRQIRNGLVSECVLVSTCNRTEVYFIASDCSSNDPIWKSLVSFKGAQNIVAPDHMYTLSSTAAVAHLFKVASGIDSMVLGDVQILHQIRESLSLSRQAKCVDGVLNKLFMNALHVAKRVRSETAIGDGAVSVGYAAAELASKIYDNVSDRSVLLIGAGKTAELTAKHLFSNGFGKLFITNRTQENACTLAAQLQGMAIDFNTFQDALSGVDVVVSSISRDTFIISASDIRKSMEARSNRPLFIIDLGVPRNVDPEVRRISNVFLNDIDDLKNIVDKNLSRRAAEISKVQAILLEELRGFREWYGALEVNPTIQALREKFDTIRRSELERARTRFSSESQEELEILTKRIVNKILHMPMNQLRDQFNDDKSRGHNRLLTLRTLFGLGGSDENDAGEVRDRTPNEIFREAFN